jgi:hypothetical protein
MILFIFLQLCVLFMVNIFLLFYFISLFIVLDILLDCIENNLIWIP